ncbi:MAG: hypothetical protein R3Y33_04965 [Clostridia bacterium]
MKKVLLVVVLVVVGVFGVTNYIDNQSEKTAYEVEYIVRSSTVGNNQKMGAVLDSYFYSTTWLAKEDGDDYEVKFEGKSIIEDEVCITVIVFDVDKDSGTSVLSFMGIIGDNTSVPYMTQEEIDASMSSIAQAVENGNRGY